MQQLQISAGHITDVRLRKESDINHEKVSEMGEEMPLITEEEFNLVVKDRDKQIEELTQNLSEAHETIYEMTKEFESLKRQQLDDEASRAADHEYYIHVPVEEECLSCPRLELETHKAADVMMHKCKHLEFCQSIRSN